MLAAASPPVNGGGGGGITAAAASTHGNNAREMVRNLLQILFLFFVLYLLGILIILYIFVRMRTGLHPKHLLLPQQQLQQQHLLLHPFLNPQRC